MHLSGQESLGESGEDGCSCSIVPIDGTNQGVEIGEVKDVSRYQERTRIPFQVVRDGTCLTKGSNPLERELGIESLHITHLCWHCSAIGPISPNLVATSK